MQVISATQLDNSMLIALSSLQEACLKVDGANIPTYPHLLETLRPQSPSLLCYEQDRLIGFLAIFYFYEDAIEVALLVHPEYRRKGVAKALWQIMYKGLMHIAYPLRELIISSPTQRNHAWLLDKGFAFEHTEYDMACIPHQIFLSQTESARGYAYAIRSATEQDIDALCLIDSTCFNAERANPRFRMEKLLTTKELSIFVLIHQNTIVGQVHLVFEHEQKVRLTDLAVLPEMQQRGFGQALLSHAMNEAYKRKQQRLSLCVAAKNQHALHLYQSVGFKIYNAVDYYKKAFHLTDFKQDI